LAKIIVIFRISREIDKEKIRDARARKRYKRNHLSEVIKGKRGENVIEG